MGDGASSGDPAIPELGFEENNQQRLDQIPIEEIINYVLDNYFDEVSERVQEGLRP